MIASGDQFVCHPDERAELRALLPEVLCVEMEGAAVAQVCSEMGLPFGVVRTISDGACPLAPEDFGRFIVEVASVGTEQIVRAILAAMEKKIDRVLVSG
jgi:adenosylhomocysteine nucleosidase